MTASAAPAAADKSKTLATWIAIIGGSLGLHRFYLHGFRDLPGWLHPLPTLIGAHGVNRALALGQDDQLAWALMPLLGCTVVAAMLAAIVYGLTSDDNWNKRFNGGRAASRGGWLAILGVMLALLVGSAVLMATIAFSSQRYFEHEYEAERKPVNVSGGAAPTAVPPTPAAQRAVHARV